MIEDLVVTVKDNTSELDRDANTREKDTRKRQNANMWKTIQTPCLLGGISVLL